MVKSVAAVSQALADAIEAQRLLVFAGSGISKTPPACLPDWAEFNASLLAPIRACALSAPAFSSAARQAIQSVEIEPARALSFSEFLVSQLARESYLPVLGVLDSPQPNDYHAALAGLARAGILRAVVTTNFDTLIEAAFRQDGVPLATYITVDDYRNKSGGDTCGLFKIHGSAAAVSTLRDTVSQKIRGLPLYVRSRLAALYRQYHVLVVGFSGADLEFGDDYLAFSAIQSEGPGITWLVRPPDASPAGAIVSRPIATLPPAAQAIVRGAGPRGAVIEADFLRLGALLNVPWRASALTNPEEAKAAADQRARAWVASWWKTVGRTPLECALFFSIFLRSAGCQGESDEINAGLEPFLEDIRAQSPLGAANLAMVLADGAKERGDANRVKELSGFALETADSADGRQPGPEESLWTKVRAMAWSNLAYVRLIHGEKQDCAEAQQTAQAYAARLDDPDTLGTMYLNQALTTEGWEPRLQLIRQAGALIIRGSSKQSAYVSLQFEALTLIRLREYDAAQAALQEGRRFLELALDPLRGRLSIEFPEADIKRLRGHTDLSYRQLDEFLPELDSHPLLSAQARINMLDMFGFSPPLRPALIRHIDWILDRMARGLIPSDGSIANFPSAPELRERRARLETGAIPSEPDFLDFKATAGDLEQAWRRRIMEFEYYQQLAKLPKCFDNLGRFKYDERNAWRLLDSAVGLIAACERIGDHNLRLEGLHRKSIGSQNLGDIWTSIEALESILQAQPPADSSLEALVHRDLGTGLSRLRNREEMQSHFRAAIAGHRTLGELEEAAQDVIDFVDALLRFDDFAAAAGELDLAQSWIAEAGRPDIGERWNGASTRLDRMRTHSNADLLNLPAELMPRAGNILPIQVIEDERRSAASAEEIRLLALEASQSARHELAADLALQAQEEFARGGDRLGVAQCIHDLAEIAQARGHWANAREQCKWAVDLRTRLGDIAGRIESGGVGAFSCFRLGLFEEAGDFAQAALALAKGHPPSRGILIAWVVLVEVIDRIGSPEQLRGLLARFLQEFPPDDRQPALAAVRNRFQSRLANSANA
jgi:hypothetical protein